MNFKTKIALKCGLSSSLLLVGSLTPTISYAVKNAKDEPKVEEDYQYTDADVLDTKTNLLVNYDRYPSTPVDKNEEEMSIIEKVDMILSSNVSNNAKVYGLLEIGNSYGITLMDWPYTLNQLKNKQLSVASKIASSEEFRQLNDLYNSLHKEYAVYEIVDKEATILNDKILASHDEQSRPDIAQLRAQNLLKYEIDLAKKSHDQLKSAANFTLNKENSLNNYYYEGNNSESFITIDQLKDHGQLDFGADITPILSNLAVNKNEVKDAFNIIQNTSYALNDTKFSLYARINDYDYSKSEGNFDITIDYGMIETKYDALPNREDFIVWYSDWQKETKENPMFALNNEEDYKNPLKYHMLLSNEIIDEWAREWFADAAQQISFIQDNEHGFDTIRKIVKEKGGLSHRFTMEEMAQFMTLPNGVEISNETLLDVNLEMVISKLDDTKNEIDYKLFLTFDFAPDVTVGSEEYQDIVSVSKKTIEDLFKTYKNIVDTVAVFDQWAYTRNIGSPFDKLTDQKLLNRTMNVLTLCTLAATIATCVYVATQFWRIIMFPWQIKVMLIGIIITGVSGLTATAVGVLFDIYNFSNISQYKGKSYSRSDYWDGIDDILAKMKDDHKNDIDNFVDGMAAKVQYYKESIEQLRKNPNPTMAEIDGLVDVFGNYEQPTSNNSKNWTLGQKSYKINNWMMDCMKEDTNKYDWMIHVKYGIDIPTHDIVAEVPCAVVANQTALASENMFKVVPWLIVTEISTLLLGTLTLEICMGKVARWEISHLLIVHYTTSFLYNLFGTILTTLGLGVVTFVFVDILKVFDFKKVDDNFHTLCRKSSSDKLFPHAAITVVGVALWTLVSEFCVQTEIKKMFNKRVILILIMTSLVYLQVATYFAMFSNFK